MLLSCPRNPPGGYAATPLWQGRAAEAGVAGAGLRYPAWVWRIAPGGGSGSRQGRKPTMRANACIEGAGRQSKMLLGCPRNPPGGYAATPPLARAGCRGGCCRGGSALPGLGMAHCPGRGEREPTGAKANNEGKRLLQEQRRKPAAKPQPHGSRTEQGAASRPTAKRASEASSHLRVRALTQAAWGREGTLPL